VREASRVPSSIRTGRTRVVTLPDGRSLSAITYTGRGTPLVLLHGLLDSAEGWRALCAATRHPCVAIDLPGFGGSNLPTHPSFSSYAADVAAALETLAPKPFVLVGHSLGGGIATALAERMPDRVLALVLLAPAGFGRIPLAEAVSMPGVRLVADRVLPAALGNRYAVASAYRFFVSNGKTASDDLLARVLEHRGTSAAGAREATKAVVRGGLSPRAFFKRRVRYDGPVTVVWGDHDRVVPKAHISGVAAAFPHVDARVWTGMGHHPQRERPANLAALIEAACRSASRPKPGPSSGARGVAA
jgi:pimeloyl-ACP methyl ester carboxylesterase